MKSVIVVAQDYGRDDPPGNPQDPARAVIARYARGEDYHTVLGEKLQGLAGWLDARANSPTNGQTKSYEVGGGAPSSPPAGPSEGEVRTSYDSLRYGPTKVYVIDATRCISYLTIEHRGSIPLDLRPGLGNRVFGCDICQEVCPWNEKFAPSAFDSAYLPREDLSGASLIDLADRLLEMSEKRYQREFSDSPLSRPRRKGMLRNLCVALGNWGRAEAIPTLERALEDSQPLVREHAAWALDRIRSHPSNKRQQ